MNKAITNISHENGHAAAMERKRTEEHVQQLLNGCHDIKAEKETEQQNILALEQARKDFGL